MTDTKGGFLSAEDDPWNKALNSGGPSSVRRGAPGGATPPGQERPKHMTVAEWERLQLIRSLKRQKAGPYEPGLSALTDEAERKKCRECGSLEIDWVWEEVFHVCVCGGCKEKHPEKYSLLTKTECREDYLLTDRELFQPSSLSLSSAYDAKTKPLPDEHRLTVVFAIAELKDAELLPHLSRPNPHKSHWHDMMLFLRCQVEEYAIGTKWGSAEALDAEFERREADKKRRKEAKFQEKLLDLKRKTRTDAFRRQTKAGMGILGSGGGRGRGRRARGRQGGALWRCRRQSGGGEACARVGEDGGERGGHDGQDVHELRDGG